jgi:hypothetical protein
VYIASSQRNKYQITEAHGLLQSYEILPDDQVEFELLASDRARLSSRVKGCA